MKLKNILNTLKDIRNYVFPIKKITNQFKGIKSKEDLKNFIQERSAHVTQTTLYGYIKTRIGSRYAMMFEDEIFSNSINIAKWNIYLSALSDCTLYVFSYLIDKKNLKQNDAEEIFNNIAEKEIENGLKKNICDDAKIEFKQRMETVDWNKYYLDNPFKNSGLALYKWSPIADNLKILDKQIVLNSIKLKWNLVENEFKELTKNLKFD
ncbi:esterase [Pelagibacteraceae bacterium]|nr:esterase [Pelagibacteraceae bacterium]